MVVMALAALLSTRGVTKLDPSSPEGVIQSYLDAALDNDSATAETYLSTELQQQGCDTFPYESYVPDDARVVLRTVDSAGNQATVIVDVAEGGVGGYTHEEHYELHREGARWAITRAPWPYYNCGLDF